MSLAKEHITLPCEPILDAVHEDDRMNVRNVIYVLHSLKHCTSWGVTPKGSYYEILGMIDSASTVNISLNDMLLIRSVDLLRVNDVSVQCIHGAGQQIGLRVHILRKTEPVVLEEQEIVQVRKKRKFWTGS